MVRSSRPAPVGQCQPLTLEERVEELMNRFKRKAADDQQIAKGGQSEASYYFGSAAAFEVVAAMLAEALSVSREGEA